MNEGDQKCDTPLHVALRERHKEIAMEIILKYFKHEHNKPERVSLYSYLDVFHLDTYYLKIFQRLILNQSKHREVCISTKNVRR